MFEVRKFNWNRLITVWAVSHQRFALMGSVAVTLRVSRASPVSTRPTVFASLKSAVLSTIYKVTNGTKVQLSHARLRMRNFGGGQG